MDADLARSYLRLYFHTDLGQAEFARLLAHYGDLRALCESPEHGEGLQALRASLQNETEVERTLRWSDEDSKYILLYEDPAYPPLLRELAVPPALLYVHGDPACLRAPGLAVVGSRKCSAYGRRQALWLASELARAGLTIISGMALGIDAAAHEAALAAGAPTIAVMGTGMNRVYPARHRALRERIAASGAVVSEYPLDTPALAENFPRRNRIVSGLALGTLVVEATLRSGSLISARQAMEQNREVFAVPGPIGQQHSRGCHRLIREGACLVEEPEDVLAELAFEARDGTGAAPARAESTDRRAATDSVQRAILAVMGARPCLYETLLRQTNLGAAELTGALLELEMSGRVQREGGRYIPR